MPSSYDENNDKNTKHEYEIMSKNQILSLLENIHNNEKIDKLLKLGYYPYVYNRCYGGGRKMSLTGNYLFEKYKEYYPEIDTSIIKAKLIEFLQEKISARYSSIYYFLVKREYKDFIYVDEYDGLETPYFNSDKYYLEKSKELINNDLLKSDEKINKIKELINLDVSTITIEDDEVDKLLESN